MKQIDIAISSSEVGAALAQDGSQLADLINEIGVHAAGDEIALAPSRITEFVETLDEYGVAILRQLSAAIDAEGR